MHTAETERMGRFVSESWRLCLGRQPSAEQMASLTAALAGGADPVDYFMALAACPEATERRASSEVIPLASPPGHYYSPIVDPRQLAASGFEARRGSDSLPGLVIDVAGMEPFITACLAEPMAFPSKQQPGRRYYYDNGMYGIGDAIVLAGIVKTLRPRRWIEIGSGFSSAALLDTLDAIGPGAPTQVTFVDPNPERLHVLLHDSDRDRVTVIPSAVQDVPLSTFDALGAGDVLFLDTTHVSKTGSDLNHELFQILPRLAEGVYVHFHDVFDGLEYPDAWIYDENRSWNEQYLLRAFLMFNTAFTVVYANDAFARQHAGVVAALCPDVLRNPGGGLWLQRVAAAAAPPVGLPAAAPTPEVQQGAEGWLFLTGGSNQVLRFYTEPDYFPDSRAREWMELLRTRQRRIAGIGAAYCHLVAPDKISVFPQLFGAPLPHFAGHPLGRLVALADEYGLAACIVDSQAALGRQDGRFPTYYKTDTHWSIRGAHIAYTLACRALGVPESAIVDFDSRAFSTRPVVFDLGSKLPGRPEEACIFTPTDPAVTRVYANPIVTLRESAEKAGTDVPIHHGCRAVFTCDRPGCMPGRLVLFGDSFADYRAATLTSFLTETFAETHFIWSTSLDYGYIERVKPDFVLSEIAERFMTALPTDMFDIEEEAKTRLDAYLAAQGDGTPGSDG